MNQKEPYNPLDKTNLGISVVEALLAEKPEHLPPTNPFDGAGIYAIYYTGGFQPYSVISTANRNGRFLKPIYVGKAIPEGSRKGGFGFNASVGKVLYNRLVDHAKSIEQVSNLSLSDFWCRYLTVDDIWIPLGENLLIEQLSPLWNLVLDGFGNHDPGSGRYNQKVSPWDVVHPGRSWAKNLAPGKPLNELLSLVHNFLE